MTIFNTIARIFRIFNEGEILFNINSSSSIIHAGNYGTQERNMMCVFWLLSFREVYSHDHNIITEWMYHTYSLKLVEIVTHSWHIFITNCSKNRIEFLRWLPTTKITWGELMSPVHVTRNPQQNKEIRSKAHLQLQIDGHLPFSKTIENPFSIQGLSTTTASVLYCLMFFV